RRTDAHAAVADAIGAKSATRPHVIAADITNGAAVSQLAREALVMNGGRIDILVNNAGASRPLADMADEAAWDESLALNFASARQLANALVPAMKEARFGRIVNLTGAMVAPSPNA